MSPTTLYLFAAVMSTLVASRALPQSTGLCKTADDVTARIIADAVAMSRGTDEDAAADRVTFGVPAALPDSAIQVMWDTTVCARLVQARDDQFRAFGAAPPPTAPVYVIRLGPKYAVYDPRVTAGEFSTVYLYDGAFQPSGGWTGP